MMALASEPLMSPLDAEVRRLSELASLRIMDTPAEHEFDTIVRCAQRLLHCKIALVSLLDDKRQWFKAKCGVEASETPREQAFCAHAIKGDDLLVVSDARKDPRFAENPLVLGPPYIRFYVGAPLRLQTDADDGVSVAIGTLCVIDDVPRSFDVEERTILRDLAQLVEALLAARASAFRATELADERLQVMQQLDLTHRQFRQAERMANIGSWRLALATETTEWSDQVYAIHGVPIGQMPSLEEALHFYPRHARAEISEALSRTIETGKPFDIEADFITAQGERRRVRTMGELELRAGQPTALIGVFQDVTERHAMEQALRRTASLDDLTRLANRAKFNEIADEKIVAARTLVEPLALLLIDLDNFKMVNDRCGHLAGDNLLCLMAAKLQKSPFADGFTARLGGDEFVLLVSSPRVVADLPGFLRLLLAELRHTVSIDGVSISVSATIGASWLDNSVHSRSELLHNADIALYEAKRANRGSAKIFGQNGVILTDDAIVPRELRAAG